MSVFNKNGIISVYLLIYITVKFIGHSAGPQKSAALVQRAFASVKYNLNRLELFHTDRGSEFKNQIIDQALATFVHGSFFPSQHDLDLELFDYVHWFNHIRIHGSLDYLTPTEYKLVNL